MKKRKKGPEKYMADKRNSSEKQVGKNCHQIFHHEFECFNEEIKQELQKGMTKQVLKYELSVLREIVEEI